MAKVLEGTAAWTAIYQFVTRTCLVLGRLTLWCGEVDDVAIRLEHVDLLDSLDGLYVHLLEGRLELLVVGSAAFVDLLDLSPWRSLAPASPNVNYVGH